MFQLCRKSNTVLQKPTSGICLFSSTGIFTSELILKLNFEALFKVKELAAARERPWGYSCIQSSPSPKRGQGLEIGPAQQQRHGKGPTARSGPVTIPHCSINWQRTVQDLTRAKLNYCYATSVPLKMSHEVQQQPDNDLTYIIPQHQHSNFLQSCPYRLCLPPAMLVQSMAAAQTCFGQSPTDRQHPGFS